MKNINKNVLIYSTIIAGVASIALISIFIAMSIWASKIETEVIAYNEGWRLNTGQSNNIDSINLPINLKLVPDNKIITIENIIPKDISNNTYLLMRSEIQRVKVYVDEKLIYSLEKDSNQLFG